MLYNWQQPDWPEFSYNPHDLEATLFAISEKMGLVSGLLQGLPEAVQTETLISIMVAEAIKTSAIEGEYLSRPDVTSSIKNKLGLNAVAEPVSDKKAAGAGELMVVVRREFDTHLTAEMLFAWHRILLPGEQRITVGAWRSHQEPMQVVSGAIGSREKVHFEAPPSHQVPAEMERFTEWFNNTAPGGKFEIKKAPIRAAITHLYFESVHPFEDGNGRIGRALAEKALSQTVGRPVILSLSQVIEAEKKSYYEAIEAAQRSNHITRWLQYFVTVVYKALVAAEELVEFTLKKARYIDQYRQQLNERQLKAVLRMLESPGGFEGGMTARKYSSLNKVSKATATRDLQDLEEKGALLLKGGGRSTHYHVNI